MALWPCGWWLEEWWSEREKAHDNKWESKHPMVTVVTSPIWRAPYRFGPGPLTTTWFHGDVTLLVGATCLFIPLPRLWPRFVRAQEFHWGWRWWGTWPKVAKGVGTPQTGGLEWGQYLPAPFNNQSKEYIQRLHCPLIWRNKNQIKRNTNTNISFLYYLFIMKRLLG